MAPVAAHKALAPRTSSTRVFSLRHIEGIEGLRSLYEFPTLKVSEPPRTSNRAFALVSIKIEGEEEKGNGKGYALYELPLQGIQDHSSDPRHLRLSFPILRYDGCDTGLTAVALGSKIYVLGGCCVSRSRCIHPGEPDWHFLSDVYCLDTLQPENMRKWERCSPMRRPRMLRVALAVDGKIYVFGGTLIDEFSAEVYDPGKDEWRFLSIMSHPPEEGACNLTPINAVVADPDGSNKRILIHVTDTQPLYAYYVDTDSWRCLDLNFCSDPDCPQQHLGTTSAVLDNILYCYSEYDGKMYSYDLIHKKWYPAEDVFRFDRVMYFASIFVVGDTLCFFWSDPQTAFRTHNLLIECINCKINANDVHTGSAARFSTSKSSVTVKDSRAFWAKGLRPECFFLS